MTFIIRLTMAADGAVNGVVERPTTGEKHRFQGAEALGVVVAQMARKAAMIAALLALIAAAAASPSGAQPTRTFTATALPTATRTRTPSFTPTSVPPSPTRTATFTNTALPTATHTRTPTFTPTSVPPTATRTATFTNTALPTATHTRTPTFTPTSVPSSPTRTATFTNTALPPATRTSTATFTSTGNPITATPTAPIPAGLSISDVSIVEGNEGTRSAVFAVRLRGQATYPVKVSAKTADGTATVADSDYDALTTALIFNASENQKTVSVTIRGDQHVETTETFSVVLGAAIGAPIADPTGIGTIISDEELSVGVPELVPANPATAPDDQTSLILRWAHPERWRALNTVDLRLRDDDRPVLWVRFDEAANTLAVCAADGRCGVGVTPETGAPIAGEMATFYPAESAVRGSGPTGPSVDLIFTFSLARSLAGRILQVETAASEDSGEQQGFLPIASLEVIDTSPSGADDDGCAIQPARGGGRWGWAMPALGLLALLGLATRCRRTGSMRNPSPIRRRVAFVGLGMALSALIPVGASAQFCLSQGDCEDGLFCTDDTCFLGVCVRTTRICADLNFQCTADSCSESARRCVHTVTVGLECEDFNIFTDETCNAQGECVAVVCSTCAGECETNVNCPIGFICSEKVCVEGGVLEDTRTPTRTPTRFRFTPITTARPSGTPTRSATRTSTATRTPTRTASRTPTRTVTRSSTATHTATRTPTATPTATSSATATPSSTLTPTLALNPTATPTESATAEPPQTDTVTPTATTADAPTATASPSASGTEVSPATATPTSTAEVESATPTATATLTRTADPTPVEQQTDTPTASPTLAATDALDTPTPSPSPTPPVQCPGDCDDDAAVGVNEVVLGVNIALNGLPISACPALDRDSSGAVDIAELVAAVSAALLGCA